MFAAKYYMSVPIVNERMLKTNEPCEENAQMYHEQPSRLACYREIFSWSASANEMALMRAHGKAVKMVALSRCPT